MIEENIVIVIDTANYKADYTEPTPFKAKITDIYKNGTWVKSLTTGKQYELYDEQILEGLEIDKISALLNMSEYGK